jgi:hypothetical protein
LGRGNVEVFDQLQDLREKVDVGGNQERITAMIRDNADPSDEIAHGANGPAIGRARVFRLASDPWKIAFFLRVLFQFKIALSTVGGLLLLSPRIDDLSGLRRLPQR